MVPVGSFDSRTGRTRLTNIRVGGELKSSQTTASGGIVIGLEENRCPVSATNLVRETGFL